MISYPNGKKTNIKKATNVNQNKKQVSSKLHLSAMNRGMNLEEDINLSNQYYLDKDMCLITKRPTPINVVKVDYSKGATITHAYFEKQSTTDYNGVYKGKYIDFEAKSTQIKTSFPLANINKHQIKHLKSVIRHDGIAFFIIEFTKRDEETFLLDAHYIIDCFEKKERSSIPYEHIVQNGHKIKRGYSPRLDYLKIVDKIYFSK